MSGSRQAPEIEPGSHLHQFGQRLSLHLLHHASPVCLHRDLADAEFAGHLLIQKSADHQCHHLMFASTKGGVTLLELPQLGFLPERNPAALQGLPNGVQQYVVRKWFGQELNSSCLHGSDCHGYVAIARYEDDRHFAPIVTDTFLQVKSAEPRKRYIEDQAVRDEGPWTNQKFLRR